MACRSCAYQYTLKKKMYETIKMKRKEVEDVLGDKEAWDNVDTTEGRILPRCATPADEASAMSRRIVRWGPSVFLSGPDSERRRAHDQLLQMHRMLSAVARELRGRCNSKSCRMQLITKGGPVPRRLSFAASGRRHAIRNVWSIKHITYTPRRTNSNQMPKASFLQTYIRKLFSSSLSPATMSAAKTKAQQIIDDNSVGASMLLLPPGAILT